MIVKIMIVDYFRIRLAVVNKQIRPHNRFLRNAINKIRRKVAINKKEKCKVNQLDVGNKKKKDQQNSGSNIPRTSKTVRTKPNDQQLELNIRIFCVLSQNYQHFVKKIMYAITVH